MSQSLILAESLCARVCHDISNPLSALSGVLDLLRRQPNNLEAAAIADEAVKAAQDRLRLFRAAWCDNDETLDANEIRSLAEGLLTGHRVTLSLDKLSGMFPPNLARLILNLLLIAVESLNGTGTVTAAGSASGGVSIGIEGAHAKWPLPLADYLAHPEKAWAALDHDGALTPLAAIVAGASKCPMRLVASLSPPDWIMIDPVTENPPTS